MKQLKTHSFKIFIFSFFLICFLKHKFLNSYNVKNNNENYKLTNSQEKILSAYIENYINNKNVNNKNNNINSNNANGDNNENKKEQEDLKDKIKKDYLAYCLAKDLKEKYYDNNNFQRFLKLEGNESYENYENKKISNYEFEENNKKISNDKIVDDAFEYLEA